MPKLPPKKKPPVKPEVKMDIHEAYQFVLNLKKLFNVPNGVFEEHVQNLNALSARMCQHDRQLLLTVLRVFSTGTEEED